MWVSAGGRQAWRCLLLSALELISCTENLSVAAQREVGDCVGAAWAERPPGMEPLVRMLLAADRYAAAGLRAECLRRLAARFDRVELGSEEDLRPGGPDAPRQRRAPRLPAHDRRVFEAFLVAVAPTVRPNHRQLGIFVI